MSLQIFIHLIQVKTSASDSAAIYKTTSWLDEFSINPGMDFTQSLFLLQTQELKFNLDFMELLWIDQISAVENQVSLHPSAIYHTCSSLTLAENLADTAHLSSSPALAKGLLSRAWSCI